VSKVGKVLWFCAAVFAGGKLLHPGQKKSGGIHVSNIMTLASKFPTSIKNQFEYQSNLESVIKSNKNKFWGMT
jgi:hypothetical protein